MEEIKDLIEKEDYDKYKKLLQEFECKAIDTIENLTWQFKEELAEEIDDKIKGWKKESERLLKENWVKDDKIKKLEQELAELKEKDNYHLRYELAGADETITNLKEQLAEKDIRIEELEGQFAYECECNMQLVDLQKQLEEKQNTIDEINKEFVQAVRNWKMLCEKKDKELSKLQASYQQDKIQLAIRELEKVKDYICDCTYIKEPDYTNVRRKIDNQIKELKGE